MYLVQPLHAQEKGGKATIILLYFEIPATGWRVLSTVYSSVLNLPWLLWLLALSTAHLLSMWLPPSNRNGQCLGSALSFQVPSSTEVSSQVHSQRQVSQNFKMCCESCRCQLWSPEPELPMVQFQGWTTTDLALWSSDSLKHCFISDMKEGQFSDPQ